MNIGNEINEALYARVWGEVWRECRQTMVKQTTPYISARVYDLIGFKIDNTLCGNIALEVSRSMIKGKYEY
jgi:hypothetical protein